MIPAYANGLLVFGDSFDGNGVVGYSDIYVVSSAAATSLILETVPNAIASTELGVKTVTLTRLPSVKAGTTKRSFTIEREFGDIDKYARFTGCMINTINLSLKPNAIVTGTFGIVGKTAALS